MNLHKNQWGSLTYQQLFDGPLSTTVPKFISIFVQASRGTLHPILYADSVYNYGRKDVFLGETYIITKKK